MVMWVEGEDQKMRHDSSSVRSVCVVILGLFKGFVVTLSLLSSLGLGK